MAHGHAAASAGLKPNPALPAIVGSRSSFGSRKGVDHSTLQTPLPLFILLFHVINQLVSSSTPSIELATIEIHPIRSPLTEVRACIVYGHTAVSVTSTRPCAPPRYNRRDFFLFGRPRKSVNFPRRNCGRDTDLPCMPYKPCLPCREWSG